MTFLSKVGIMEILCSIRLVPECEESKEIPQATKLTGIKHVRISHFHALNS